jgi:hypothetical protein
MEIQLRSETTGMTFAKNFAEAAEAVEKDSTIWKISFTFNGQRHRLLRVDGRWENRPLDVETVDGKTVVKEDLTPVEPLFRGLLRYHGIMVA